MNRSLRVALGLGISAVFLYLAFRGQDFGEIRDSLGRTNLWWLIPALALYMLGVYLRAIRWRILLRPVAPNATSNQLFPIVAIGFMANNVLPLRAGEIVRSVVVGRELNVSKTSTLATIAVERIFDGVTMLAFLAFSMIFVSLTSELQHLAIVSFIVFAGLLLGLGLLTFAGDFVSRMLQLVLGPLPAGVATRVEQLAESFLGGLGVLKSRGDLARVMILSIGAWLLEASMYYLLAIGFGEQVRAAMDPAVTLLTTGVANLSTLIPGAPGYIGQFEYGVKLVLNGAFDVAESQALAYAILVHAALYFPITLAGLVLWFRRSLRFSDLREDPVTELT
ncbi:MAG: flippase-like domain-containing protein [Thermomicrobiales bacterium]|nr:flippase-like domain-containing protein [Thermomicrobiales bacterium]